MPGATKIEWTERTWNPVVGCSKVSEGCRFCYAKTLHDRRHRAKLAGKPLPEQYSLPFERVQLRPERLGLPLRWKGPARIFVNSVSDLFHGAVPFPYIAAVLGVIAATPQHTYQVLTKRPERALEFFRWLEEAAGGHPAAFLLEAAAPYGVGVGADSRWDRASPVRQGADSRWDGLTPVRQGALPPWPLPNLWLGVSVEDQRAAERRIPLLRQAPAALRFLSCEPLLGPLEPGLEGIGWVIAGGESGGAGVRPMQEGWVRSLLERCRRAGVPFFFKQAGRGLARAWGCRDPKGADPTEWPPDLRVREWPRFTPGPRPPSREGAS